MNDKQNCLIPLFISKTRQKKYYFFVVQSHFFRFSGGIYIQKNQFRESAVYLEIDCW